MYPYYSFFSILSTIKYRYTPKYYLLFRIIIFDILLPFDYGQAVIRHIIIK